MKQYHKILLRATLLLIAVCLVLCSCQKQPGQDAESTAEQAPPIDPSFGSLGNGLAFSIADAEVRNLDMQSVCSLMGLMNLQTVHLDVDFGELLDENGALYEASAARYTDWITAMQQNGVKNILLTLNGATWGAEYDVADPLAFPYPDSEQDSQYTEFLELYQKSFATLAAAFPQVTYWQAGQSMNLDENAHPVKGRFTVRDKASLAVDLSHAARMGINSVRTDCHTVFSGVSAGDDSNGAVSYLEQCYRYLAGGESPYGVLSADVCFDAMSWTPYLNWYAFDGSAFVTANRALYDVMESNNAVMPVLLADLGFSDFGSRMYDLQQGEWLGVLCESVRSQMPYVAAFYPGSLLETGDREDTQMFYSGLFRVFDRASFGAKEKAKALCTLYKGVNEELDRYQNDNLVYEEIKPGDTRNGIGFAIKGAEERGLNIEKIMDLLEIMNVQSMRNWMNIRTLLTSPTTLNQREVELQKQWIAQLNQRGITKIVGMSHGSFWPEQTTIYDEYAVPYRDLDEGSLYLAYLADFEQSWYTLASTFPEINYWEVGNETNYNTFLHPLGYSTDSTKVFTNDEKALIAADLCYTAAKAVRRANPNATVIFPGMAPVKGFSTMSTFLERVYTFIEEGKCIGGTDPDAYFDAVAWHCYYFSPNTFTPENWLEGHNSVYQVMVNHGDGDKKVFLTEFGFSDGGKQEKDLLQASYYREIFAMIDQMPYVECFFPFRTIEDETAASWGGTIEIYYGMFRVFDAEHFGAKEKAKVLCELYGGDLSKLDQYSGGMTVYPR